MRIIVLRQHARGFLRAQQHHVLAGGRLLVGQVVAAHVQGYRLVVAGEVLQLRFPGVPELGEAMDGQDERAPGAGAHVVQARAVDVGIVVFHGLRRVSVG
jgi:hypothetical protein